MQPLASSRMILEPLVEAHADEMFHELQNARLYTFVPQDPPASLGALRTRHTRLESRQSADRREAWLNWALRARVGAQCLGCVQATVFNQDKTALIAYTIFPQFWRQGYAKEAVLAVLNALFTEFDLSAVDALIDTRNVGSIALMESCRFSRIEWLPNADHFKGSNSDEYRYRLERSHWHV